MEDIIKNKLSELKKIGGLKNNDRLFKIGDVIRFVGPGQTTDAITEKGLGIVVSIDGPLFEIYWVGDGKISKADARWPGIYKLQDIVPVPQVAEWVRVQND